MIEGNVVVVDDDGARRFAKLVKLNPVRCKVCWLLVCTLLQLLNVFFSHNEKLHKATIILLVS